MSSTPTKRGLKSITEKKATSLEFGNENDDGRVEIPPPRGHSSPIRTMDDDFKLRENVKFGREVTVKGGGGGPLSLSTLSMVDSPNIPSFGFKTGGFNIILQHKIIKYRK